MSETIYEVGAPTRYFPRQLKRGVTGVQTFSKGGELEVRVGNGPIFRFPHIVLLTEVIATVGVAPTGSSIIVDVNKNGTSIFGGGPKPTIPIGANVSDPVRIVGNLILPSDNVQVDIDQIGSANTGENLTVELRYRTAR